MVKAESKRLGKVKSKRIIPPDQAPGFGKIRKMIVQRGKGGDLQGKRGRGTNREKPNTFREKKGLLEPAAA